MKKILPFIILFIIYFGTRVPLYTHQLIGEEGLFANIFYNRPSAPNYLLYARVNGKDFYDLMAHPALLYVPFSAAGKFFSAFLNLRGMSDNDLTMLMRFTASLFQWIVWSAAMILLLKLKNRGSSSFLHLLLIAVLVSPLAVGSSIMLQLDGTSGVLMCGLVALAICLKAKNIFSPRTSLILFVLATGYLGFGKPDWSIVFGGAILLTILWAVATKSLEKDLLYFLIGGLVGCALGNLGSCLIFPENYIGGAQVFASLSKGHTVFDAHVGDLWSRTLERMPFILHLLALLIFLFVVIAKTPTPLGILSFLFASGLFGAYFLSSWSSTYRYFAPSLMAAAMTCILFIPEKIGLRIKLFVIALLVFNVIHLGLFVYNAKARNLSVTLNVDTYLLFYNEIYQSQIRMSKEYTCIPILPLAMAFREPNQDFIITSLSENEYYSFAEEHHSTICP